MVIALIEGSPHRNGSTAILSKRFIKGAEESGHTVHIFDAAHAEISPCMACEFCHAEGKGKCAIDDDMTELRDMILSSDIVVFSTPVYFFSMSAQMKAAIDRMYAFLGEMSERVKAMALIAAANNPNPHIMDVLVANYLSIVSFLGVKNAGMILASGCGTPEATATTEYPAVAYRLGRTI